MEAMTAGLGTAAELRAQLAILQQINSESAKIGANLDRGAGGGGFVPTRAALASNDFRVTQDFGRLFDQQWIRKQADMRAQLRGTAAETRLSARMLGRNLMGTAELLSGNVSMYSVKDTAESVELLSRKLGFKRVAAGAAALQEAMIPAAGGMAVARAVREAYNFLIEHYRGKVESEFKALEKGESAYQRIFAAQRHGRTGDLNLGTGQREFGGELRQALRDERLRNTDMDAWSRQGVERFESLTKSVEQAMQEPATASRMLRQMRETLNAQRDPQSPPITKAALRDWMIQITKQEQEKDPELRNRQINAVLWQFDNLAKKLEEQNARNALDKEQRELAGERDTGGIRNSVLWAQRDRQMRAIEDAEIKRYVDWNDH